MASVVIIYSHKDDRWLKRLQTHLRPVERAAVIDLWADTRIRAGKDWVREIDAALANARIAILLVSADFLASEFITSTELPALLLKAGRQQCEILPVIVGPCLFSRMRDLQLFQAINHPEKPLSGMRKAHAEAMLAKVAESVLEIARPAGGEADVALRAEPAKSQGETAGSPRKFVGDPRVDELIQGIRLADWDNAAETALRVIADTDSEGHNRWIEALLGYKDCPDDDDRFWGAFHTLESALRIAPSLISHAQVSEMADHPNFSVRSSAASMCMDLAHAAPHQVPLDILVKLSKYYEDWYVQAPANAALKAMARSFPDVLRIFYMRLRSDVEEERAHAAYQIAQVAEVEPGLIEPDLVREELARLKKLGDSKNAHRLSEILSRVKGAKRSSRYRYRL